MNGVILHPLSRGSVHIASADVNTPPAIDLSTCARASVAAKADIRRDRLLRQPAGPGDPALHRQVRAQGVQHRPARGRRPQAGCADARGQRDGRGARRVHQEQLRTPVPPRRLGVYAPPRGRRRRGPEAEGVRDGERARGAWCILVWAPGPVRDADTLLALDSRQIDASIIPMVRAVGLSIPDRTDHLCRSSGATSRPRSTPSRKRSALNLGGTPGPGILLTSDMICLGRGPRQGKHVGSVRCGAGTRKRKKRVSRVSSPLLYK